MDEINEKNINANHSRRKKKGTSALKWLYILLILAFSGVAIFSICQIISITSENNSGADYYEDMKEEFFYEDEEETVPVTTAASDEKEEQASEETETTEYVWSLKKVNFGKLKEYNSDVKAWLELPGTIIDYPVAQGCDNNQYLRTLLDGSYHRFGTLFLDYRNADDFSDYVNVIYGHHIKAGDMFCIVENYADKSFFKEHPFFVLYTPDVTYKLEPYAAVYYNNITDAVQSFSDANEYQQYIDDVISNSVVKSDVEMDTSYKTVVLYTCSDRVEDGRFVLPCKLTVYK